MSRIDSFSFGTIVIGGNTYKEDVLLFPDGTVKKRQVGWFKMDSHTLKRQEQEQLVRERPEVIILGTGAEEKLRVPFEAERYIAEAKIEFIGLPSPEAVAKINQLVDAGKRVAALIHITC